MQTPFFNCYFVLLCTPAFAHLHQLVSLHLTAFLQVCALSVLAERPDVIKRIVLTQEHNPAGAYQVRLCRAGQWHTLTIDDTFPVNALSMLAYLKVGSVHVIL